MGKFTVNGAAFHFKVSSAFKRLGIPLDYGRQRGLELQPEATPQQMIFICESVFDHRQPQYLEHTTTLAWDQMRLAAIEEGVKLQLVSGFRSVERQEELIRYQIVRKGRKLDEVLQWIAAPGYSEHHTGKALDIGDENRKNDLNVAFEDTKAFGWLERNARRFGFSMSFPSENSNGIGYEPWHWRHGNGRNEPKLLTAGR